MSVKVHETVGGKSEEVQVSGLETPFRLLLRNIVPVKMSASASATNQTAQVYFFHCLNDTRSTLVFNCTDVDETVMVECDGLGEYVGNMTCPTKRTAPACRYWNAVNSTWSSDGCTAVGTTDDGLYTICECTHLTDFSTQVDQALSQVTQHFKKVISHKVTAEDLKKNIVLLLVMGAFFLLYVVSFFYVSRWDHKDRMLHLRQKRLAMHETKHVKLNTSPIFQEPEYLTAVGWKAKARVVVKKFWNGLKDNHKLVSIAFKYDEHFTRTQRLTVIFTVVMSQMFTNALLYRLKQGEKTLGSALVAGVVSFLCMIPVTIAFMLMFKKAGRKQTYLVRYRVEDIEGNVAEVETDAYGQPKQYSPLEVMSMDLAAMANCVEARTLHFVAQEIKRQGVDSKVAQICRGIFLAVYNRDYDEDPPEDDGTNDDNDPLKSVIVKIKAHLEHQVLRGENQATGVARKSIMGSFSRKRRTLTTESTEEPGGKEVSSSEVALAHVATRSENERRALAMNQLLLMLGQGGGDTMISNMLKFDPLKVSTRSADKIHAICDRYKVSFDEGDEDDDNEGVDDENAATALMTLHDWLAKCGEYCAAQERDAHVIAAKAKAELERTEMQLKKLQAAIASQFEKRLSEIVTFAANVGTTATTQNVRMVQHATESVQAARRATRMRARASAVGVEPPKAADRRLTVTIKKQKNAILQANKQQLRERRKTVKETQKILNKERKKIEKEVKKEMEKLVAGMHGVAKMKRKLQIYQDAREKRKIDALPLHEQQLYRLEKERLKSIKGTSLVLYNQFLRRQPAKIAKPLFPEWVIYVSYVICFVWCVWCTFFVAMFAFEIGQVESQLWIGSLVTGLAMTHVVSDPMKIFFRMGIMPLIATSVLADSGIFGAVDTSALAIGAIAAVGTAGVAQLVARRKEENAEKRRLKQSKGKRLVPVVDDEQELRAEALAIAGRAEESIKDDEDEQEPAPQQARGSFTNLWSADERQAEEYARQRAAIEREMEEDELKEQKELPTIPSSSTLKLAVTKGPPVQMVRPPVDEAKAGVTQTLAQQSSSVLKDKPASVFGPDALARRPPPTVPRGPLVATIKSPPPKPVEVTSDAVQPLQLEQCVCGERLRPGDELANHQANLCPHRLVECRAGCGLFIQARSRNGHELSQCRLAMCACGKMVLTQSLELHQQRECRNKLVSCRLDCGKTMASHTRDRHERNECPRRVATCPHCGAVKHTADMESHVATECEVHKANEAVHSAIRASYAAPPPQLNRSAIRGPPFVRREAMPGVVTGESEEAQKLEALRERVRARRPPGLDLARTQAIEAAKTSSPTNIQITTPVRGPPLAAVSPMEASGPSAAAVGAARPRLPVRPPAYPPPRVAASPPKASDMGDMSPTRRKMLLGPQAIAVADAAAVASPRADEVVAAALVAPPRAAFAAATEPLASASLESATDVQDISNLVFESTDSDIEASPSSQRRGAAPTREPSVARSRPPKKKYEV